MSDERKKEETQAMKDAHSRYDMPIIRDSERAPHYKLLMPDSRSMEKRLRRDKRA